MKKLFVVLLAVMLAGAIPAEGVYEQVAELYNARQYAEAEALAKELLPDVEGRDKCMVLRYLGLSLRYQGKYSEAMKAFEALGKVDDVATWFYWESVQFRAEVLSESGRVDEAIALLRNKNLMDKYGLAASHRIAASRQLARELVKKSDAIIFVTDEKTELYNEAQELLLKTVKTFVPSNYAARQQMLILNRDLDFGWIKENKGLTREEFFTELKEIHPRHDNTLELFKLINSEVEGGDPD